MPPALRSMRVLSAPRLPPPAVRQQLRLRQQQQHNHRHAATRALATAAAGATDKKKVIIDTDPGCDDAMAFVCAIHSASAALQMQRVGGGGSVAELDVVGLTSKVDESRRPNFFSFFPTPSPQLPARPLNKAWARFCWLQDLWQRPHRAGDGERTATGRAGWPVRANTFFSRWRCGWHFSALTGAGCDRGCRQPGTQTGHPGRGGRARAARRGARPTGRHRAGRGRVW